MHPHIERMWAHNHVEAMRIARPLHALGWLVGGTFCVVLAARLYGSAIAPKSSAGLICWSVLCFVMFLNEIARKVSPKTSTKLSVNPLKPSVYTVFFRAMKKADIKFSRNADALLMDTILEDHVDEKVTVKLILACFGNLYARGKIRPRNFAAVPPGDDVALKKAIKKLSPDTLKTIYSTQVYGGTILISIDDRASSKLNSALEPYDIEFNPYPLGE